MVSDSINLMSGDKPGSLTYSHAITPYVFIDYDAAVRNADSMLERANKLGVRFRPHVKTHKTLQGADLQIGGAENRAHAGIVVSTLSELDFFGRGGFGDILYAVPLVGAEKIKHVCKVHLFGHDTTPSRPGATVSSAPENGRRPPDRVKVVFDHKEQLNLFLQVAQSTTVADLLRGSASSESLAHSSTVTVEDALREEPLPVLLMLRTGGATEPTGKHRMHQVGLDPQAEATCDLAEKIHRSQCLCFAGGYIHAAHSYCCEGASAIREVAVSERDAAGSFAATLKAKTGLDCASLGVGSTPTCAFPPADGLRGDHLPGGGVNELHGGNYLVYDAMQCLIGSCERGNIGLFVRATVISSTEGRLLIDMGWTGMSAQGAEFGYGRIVSHPELQILTLKQETGEVGMSDPDKALDHTKYPLGTVVTIAPYHSCAAGHQYEGIWVEKGGKIVDYWKRAPAR